MEAASAQASSSALSAFRCPRRGTLAPLLAGWQVGCKNPRLWYAAGRAQREALEDKGGVKNQEALQCRR